MNKKQAIGISVALTVIQFCFLAGEIRWDFSQTGLTFFHFGVLTAGIGLITLGIFFLIENSDNN